MTRPHTPASDRLVSFDWWLTRRLAELSQVASFAVQFAILTACAALVIVTAVLFLSTPGA